MTYHVKAVFLTIQGEGFHVGTPAVFLRFVGCNVWSGRDEDRARDAAKGVCAAWCDTDFTHHGAQRFDSAQALADEVESASKHVARVVVITGGEPSLQLDGELVAALRARGFSVHVETNGSNYLPHVDWVTLSPKPPLPVVLKHVDEVKVVVPDVNPLDWDEERIGATFRYVQPRDPGLASPRLRLWKAHTDDAIDFVLKHRGWRLSVQQHKAIGVP